MVLRRTVDLIEWCEKERVSRGLPEIGYDTPFTGNTAFNAPMLTDVLLGFMWGLLAITTTASIVAVVRGIRRANRSEGMTNVIPYVV